MSKQFRTELVLEHQKLVDEIFPEYRGKGVDEDDLKQEGVMALCEAARRAKPIYTAEQFASYARFWIRKFMVRAVAKRSLINRTRSDREVFRSLTAAARTLTEQGILNPTIRELARAAFVRVDRALEAFLVPSRVDVDTAAVVVGETSVHEDEIYDAIECGLASLVADAPMTANVVRYWFGVGQPRPFTRFEIAGSLGITAPQVSAFKQAGLEYLHNYLAKQGFAPSVITRVLERRVA